MSDARMLLCDADYTLIQPANGLETLWWLAKNEHLDADRIIASARMIEHETGLGAYSATQWFAKVLELSGYPAMSEHRLMRLMKRLARAHWQRLVRYPGFRGLMRLCHPPGWVKAIVSGKGHLSRDATFARLPGFDCYGFSCDSYRWNKSENPHAYRDMAEQLQQLQPEADFERAVVLEDDYLAAANALLDGAGMVVVLLHEGGIAQRDIGAGNVAREDLEASGLMLADNLEDAVRRLRQSV